VRQPGKPGQSLQWLKNGEPAPAPGLEAGIDQIVELAVPFELLGVKPEQPVQFFVELVEGGHARDRAPREGAILLNCPSPDFEQIMWDV